MIETFYDFDEFCSRVKKTRNKIHYMLQPVNGKIIIQTPQSLDYLLEFIGYVDQSVGSKPRLIVDIEKELIEKYASPIKATPGRYWAMREMSWDDRIE